MRISHYNDSIPLWEEFTENTAQLNNWLNDIEAQFASERCQTGDAIQTANALDAVRALIGDVAAKRNEFQQLAPLAGWKCVGVDGGCCVCTVCAQCYCRRCMYVIRLSVQECWECGEVFTHCCRQTEARTHLPRYKPFIVGTMHTCR